VLPTLAEVERPLECEAGPGDVFYLPGGWAHLTLNLGETVGIGGQIQLSVDDQRTIGEAARAGDPEAQFQAARAATQAKGSKFEASMLHAGGYADIFAAGANLTAVAKLPNQLSAMYQLAEFQIANAAALPPGCGPAPWAHVGADGQPGHREDGACPPSLSAASVTDNPQAAALATMVGLQEV
jgi:hypothetical protein